MKNICIQVEVTLDEYLCWINNSMKRRLNKLSQLLRSWRKIPIHPLCPIYARTGSQKEYPNVWWEFFIVLFISMWIIFILWRYWGQSIQYNSFTFVIQAWSTQPKKFLLNEINNSYKVSTTTTTTAIGELLHITVNEDPRLTWREIAYTSQSNQKFIFNMMVFWWNDGTLYFFRITWYRY